MVNETKYTHCLWTVFANTFMHVAFVSCNQFETDYKNRIYFLKKESSYKPAGNMIQSISKNVR